MFVEKRLPKGDPEGGSPAGRSRRSSRPLVVQPREVSPTPPVAPQGLVPENAEDVTALDDESEIQDFPPGPGPNGPSSPGGTGPRGSGIVPWPSTWR